MSGGFFRGTSADQDTRFSNKMSRLLKTQKFAPELDVLIDMAKVKMDVIRPWIATRVTELLGFEDEVLINFIYGLLDVKEADGKHLQIQLTGFMEKNTGRFMKELWVLLTSAQNNISGIPQQFLDAKAEEAKKKKDEKERILSEVQRKKEEQEKDMEERKEQERLRKLSVPQGPPKRSLSPSPGRRGGDGGHAGRNGKSSRKSSVSPRGSRSSTSSPSRGSPSTRRRSRSFSPSPRRRRRSGSPFRRRSAITPPRRRRTPVYSRSPVRKRRSPPSRLSPRNRSRTPPRARRRSSVDVLSPPRRRSRGPRSPERRRSPSGSISPPVARRSASKSPYSRGRSASRERPVRRSKSPVSRRKSPARRRTARVSRSPYQRRRSPSRDRDVGGSTFRSPYRRKGSPSREHGGGRRNGYEMRDRDRPPRDGERADKRNDRSEKYSDERPASSREQERQSQKEGRDNRLSDLPAAGEKRAHHEDDDVEIVGAKRDIMNTQDGVTAVAAGKSAPSSRGHIGVSVVAVDDGKRSGDRRESAAGPVDADRESRELESRSVKVAGVKGGTDAVHEEEGTESPGSSEERHEAKRRRKEGRRLRKEEKRKKREERHRRREEKRAARLAKAGRQEHNGVDDKLQNTEEHRVLRERVGLQDSRKDQGTEEEQQRIENELRHKALESLRAKKAFAG